MSYSFHAVKEAAESAVLAQFGLEKQAFNPARLFTYVPVGAARFRASPIAGLRALGKAQQIGRGVLEVGREMTFGSPVNTAAQIRRYVARHGGSVPKGVADFWRSYYWKKPQGASDLLFQGLGLAQTGYAGYQAYKTEDPEERKRALARFGAGVVVNPFVGRLGIPGMLAQQALESGAERLVAGPRKPPAPVDPAQQNAQPQLPPVAR